MVLIHADLSEPQTCVNVLDLNTQLGECEKLLSVGEFSCEHDFCPKCTKDGGEGYQGPRLAPKVEANHCVKDMPVPTERVYR